MSSNPTQPSNEGLTAKFTRGVLWTGGSTIFTVLARLLIIAFLARLLEPKDFGLFGLTLLLIEFGEDISDFGVGPAIIQRASISQRLLSTVFWTVALGGVAFFFIGIMAAPVFAWFFKEEALSGLIIVSSISFIIRGFGAVHRVLLQKSLLFHKVALVEVGSTLVFGLVTISFAARGGGVWSLVYGLLAHRLSDLLILLCVSRFRPSLELDAGAQREVFHFGRKVIGERVTYFLSSRMDYFVIGRLLGPAPLGYYTLASEIPTVVPKRVAAVVARVAFPAFSRVQGEPERMRTAFKNVNKVLSLLAFPALATLAVFAEQFVAIFYGSGWEAAVLPMRILCIGAAIRSVMRMNGTILYVKNRPDLAFRWGLIQLFTIPIPLVLGAAYGLPGVATALSLTFIAYFFYIQRIVNSLIAERLSSYLLLFIPSVAATTVLVVATTTLKITVLRLIAVPDWLLLSTGVIFATLVYATAVSYLDRTSVNQLKSVIGATFRPEG